MTIAYPQTQRVAASFSKAAITYDQAAVLQQFCAQHMLERFVPKGVVLDLGCGTGMHTQTLARSTAVVQTVGIDVAAGMLAYAQASLAQASTCSWLQADARCLPLADDSVDSAFSNLMVQWLGADSAVFHELWRVLRPGAEAVMSTLLPGTLVEIDSAWQAVDASVHINRFDPQADWLAAARAAGFDVTVSTATHRRYFPTAIASARELKALGARNMNQGQATGLTGRQRFQQFATAYETWRCEQGLPATYRVLFLKLRKPRL